MIESVVICNVATFDDQPQRLDDLRAQNFLFGSNGTGKTTVSRVLADPTQYTSCAVHWRHGQPLEVRVYNRDFVNRNFAQSRHIKGVFTLGEEQVDAAKKIAALEEQRSEVELDLRRLVVTLEGEDGYGGLQADRSDIEAELRDACWAAKTEHDELFKPVFTGYRNSGPRFASKILEERERATDQVEALSVLRERARALYEGEQVEEARIPDFSPSTLLRCEGSDLLRQKIVGRQDVALAPLIEALGNSDWVHRGLEHVHADNDPCPFCQRPLTAGLLGELSSYFDKSYSEAIKGLQELQRDYAAGAELADRYLADRVAEPPRFLDLVALVSERERFDALVSLNKLRISDKLKEPSAPIELESIEIVRQAVQGLIDEANAKAEEHNRVVRNLHAERAKLSQSVWSYLIRTELASALATYDTRLDGWQKGVTALESQIAQKKTEMAQLSSEIRRLEQGVTSTQPTVEAMNALLESLGFTSFTLAAAAEKDTYKLVRRDGTDAQDTLSEGERSFVTFLYFYHLVRGSDRAGGVRAERVIVIDDPVSSLDSEVLFVVSTLSEGCVKKRGKAPVP